VDLGRTMLRMWLELTRSGLAAHPQSHVIDCPDTSERLARLAGAVDERVMWVARVGRPDLDRTRTFPISARRLRKNAETQGRPNRRAGAGRPPGDLLRGAPRCSHRGPSFAP
jgi:hypothetical protein